MESCSPSPVSKSPPDRRPARRTNISRTPASSESRQILRNTGAENALQVLRRLQKHSTSTLHGDEEIKLHLSTDQYLQLLKALESDQALDNYTKCKARWDYDPSTSLIRFRMPTPVHEFFAVSVANEICEHLREIASNKNAAGEFAALIANGGSSRMILKDGDTKLPVYPQREPDAQFQHPDALYPGVVMEISYAQKGSDLRKLAWDYIMHSNGNIKVVIGIDINYGDTKESTLSLWRSSYIKEEGEELDILEISQDIKNQVTMSFHLHTERTANQSQPFRAQDGSPVNIKESVRFKLSDFAPDQLSAGFQGIEICIKYEKLAEMLNRAEQMHQARELRPGIKSERQTRKRKLSSSAADEIKTDDEAKYSLAEKKAEASSTAYDVDFVPVPPRKRKG
ncbi:uncharacterized protein TRUGW13939_02945 [Talaromyces rugulosus]|uniref:Uncharacterized protein n=1 Tax=Talaromyces rugulosus TaxID=121627 RepID=A0A7H8QPR0_TALRU|nr:uncharacterized protein TRUGW13939_02945 [Talaromyces rugulosus]QKX55846.1 hypothetical protein TRUGW13939_02945 [Talaromyces rugulosus]